MKTAKLSAAIAAVMFGTIAAGTAQAVPLASAQSVVTISNFTIKNSGGTQIDYSQLDAGNISLTSTQDSQASLNGPAVSGPHAESHNGSPLATQMVMGTLPAATLPSNLATEFANNLPANSQAFTALDPVTAPANLGNFAASAANELGSPVTGSINGGPISGPGGATLHAASYAVLTSDGTAGSNTNSGLSVKYQFTLASGFSGPLTFSADVAAYLADFLSLGYKQTAKSAFNLTFDLIQDSTQLSVINGTTAKLNGSTALAQAFGVFSGGDIVYAHTTSNPGPGNGLTNKFGSIDANGNPISTNLSFDTLALASGIQYDLTITLNTDANVALTVPEPGILALMGIGLLGAGASSRKFSKSNKVTYA